MNDGKSVVCGTAVLHPVGMAYPQAVDRRWCRIIISDEGKCFDLKKALKKKNTFDGKPGKNLRCA